MEDDYNDILRTIRTEKGTQKVVSVPVQEVESKIESETDWYESMIGQSKKAGEFVSEPSASIEKKPQISPLLSPILATPEIAGQLTWGVASWLPSKITGAATGALMKLSNALLTSEQKSKGRIPEERVILQKIEPFSPEKIREMQDKTEAWWQIMPPPATKEAKDVLEKVGKGLDWLLGPFKTADEYYTEKGFPVLGYNLRAIGELLYFKGLHGLGTKITPKVKALRKKLIRKVPPDELAKHLEKTLDEIKPSEVAPKGDELKRVTKSQKIRAHKIQREHGLSKAEYMEIAERVSGETSIKDMNKASANRFIEELKKGKEVVKIEPTKEVKEVKIEEKKAPPVERPVVEEKIVEPIVEKPPVEEPKPSIDTPESLAEEFNLRYMGEMGDLKLYSMKVSKGETTIATKGVSREALVKRIKETKEEFEAAEVKKEVTESVVEKPPTKVKPSEVKPEPPMEVKPPIKPELPSEAVRTFISDDIRTAEDMGIYAEVREMLGEKKRIGEIMKEVKQKAYYKEDLADFGYVEKNIREAIRAIKAEMGDERAIKQIQTILKKEKKKVEKITEAEKIESKEDLFKDDQNEIVIGYHGTQAKFKDGIFDDTMIQKLEHGWAGAGHYFSFKKESARLYSEIGEGKGRIIEANFTIKNPINKKDVKYRNIVKETIGRSSISSKEEGIAVTNALKKKGYDAVIAGEMRLATSEINIFDAKNIRIKGKKVTEIKRVDPETGRPAGIKEDLVTTPKEVDEIRMKWEQEQIPIIREDGSIAKSKFVAMKRAKELGRTGDLVKNSKGEGWLVKKTKEQRETKVKEDVKEWEDILKEEELGDLGDEGLGERVDVDIDTVFDPLKGERGAITFHRKTVKELKRIVKKGYYTRNRIIRELRKRGASDEDILKVFPDASVRILNKGVESKWWKEGQDPLELLPRRTLPNKLKAPAITRGEAHMIATMKDMPARLTAEHLSWENAIRTFEKLPPEAKETFYRSVKEGESLAFDSLQDVLKRSKKIRQFVNYYSHKRIGTHAIAQQPDGIAVLAQQGITKIPKLRPKELKAYEDLRTIYEEFFVSVNRARKVAGEKPFPPIDNYFTWIQDITYLSKVEGVGLFSNWRTIESKMAEIKKVPSFRFAKFRAGPEKPRKLNLNPFTVIDTYAKTATHYVEMAPRLAKLNELLTEKYGMAQNAPHAYNFIRHWLNFQAGKIPAWDIAHSTTRWAMRKLNSNIVYSLLAYNVRSALIQPAAMASSYAVLGEYYTAVGLSHMMSPAKWKMAGKKSNILNTRSPEVAIYEAMAGTKGVMKGVTKVGMFPLTALDSVAARVTWLGAYAKGLKKFKSEQKAINYADDIVTRTQASAAKSDIAPIQRTQLGKTITCLQTFVINHWGFLTKDVLGIKNADIKNPIINKRVIRFLLATTAVNVFFEDGLGMNSPNPTPIRAFREKFEETEDYKEAFSASIKEIAEYIPLFGGRLRYGTDLGGPVVAECLKLIDKGDEEALIKLMGTRGANQFFKMVRAHERGGTDIDIALGRYVEPKKKKGITSSIKSP